MLPNISPSPPHSFSSFIITHHHPHLIIGCYYTSHNSPLLLLLFVFQILIFAIKIIFIVCIPSISSRGSLVLDFFLNIVKKIDQVNGARTLTKQYIQLWLPLFFPLIHWINAWIFNEKEMNISYMVYVWRHFIILILLCNFPTTQKTIWLMLKSFFHQF